LPHEFLLSRDVWEEAVDVLTEKFSRLRTDVEEALYLIRVEVVSRDVYRPLLDRVPPLRDPEDAHVLAAALATDCDLLVTGEKDLLVLREVGKLRIIKPSMARKILGV
jgi:putative PIN family toxin of toxin-antitoxin system